MPELNLNYLNPSGQLGPDYAPQLNPMQTREWVQKQYAAREAEQQNNMLAQLYAKHYDPQTGGVNYNSLIGEAAQNPLTARAIPDIMGEAQKQSQSMAEIAQKRALQKQEEATATAKQDEIRREKIKEMATESYGRFRGVKDAESLLAWHLANPELEGTNKAERTAKLQQDLKDKGYDAVRAEIEGSLQAITGIKPEGAWKDVGDRLVLIDPITNKEISSIKKGATPGQVMTNERLTASGVNSANYPLLAQGIAEGRISPDRVNSRNATILEQALRLNPNADLNQLAGQGALARNPAFQQKAMAVESIPEVIKSVAEAGKKLNFSDNVKAIAEMQKWYAGQTQDPKLTEYMTLRNDSLMSIAYAMRQAGMSDYATRMEAEAASPSMSPAQLDAWVNAQMKALEPRLKQYRSVSVTGGNAIPPPAGAGMGAGAQTPAATGEWGKATVVPGGK
ncbi:hypothetical protein UFOVP830_18 [uncultured Caudovirales phage]|uniref:Uncharacterized protein n=1 Tax=uncultured Caudovirales phage TaxID=2100421 RepID=A0A6J5P4J9_9CAUD|nr:hypothetical protein UFOVP830_18 [uncultured Caudovirales phage]